MIPPDQCCFMFVFDSQGSAVSKQPYSIIHVEAPHQELLQLVRFENMTPAELRAVGKFGTPSDEEEGDK